ncbi:MAG: bifunctional hydroxymethylpyrimidine kinase/phosphomethylpyrimidine kinase [Campylobacterales bacterium]
MKSVLTIGGSDSSGGAGIQADLKTFEAFGVYGMSVITVLTAQNTTGVQGIFPLEPAFVLKQIDSVLEDIPVDAIKIGMLYSAEIIDLIADIVSMVKVPVVLDPVSISKAGSPLLHDEAIEALRHLVPLAMVVTPNRYEARLLFGSEDTFAFPGVPVVVKNFKEVREGHEVSVDRLYTAQGVVEFTAPWIETNNLHGSGCSFASAIAALLASGYDLIDAIKRARAFVTEAIRKAPGLGHGPGPLNHKAGGVHAFAF